MLNNPSPSWVKNKLNQKWNNISLCSVKVETMIWVTAYEGCVIFQMQAVARLWMVNGGKLFLLTDQLYMDGGSVLNPTAYTVCFASHPLQALDHTQIESLEDIQIVYIVVFSQTVQWSG